MSGRIGMCRQTERYRYCPLPIRAMCILRPPAAVGHGVLINRSARRIQYQQDYQTSDTDITTGILYLSNTSSYTQHPIPAGLPITQYNVYSCQQNHLRCCSHCCTGLASARSAGRTAAGDGSSGSMGVGGPVRPLAYAVPFVGC